MNNADALVSSALRSIRPRPSFSDELLRMLRETPLLALESAEGGTQRLRVLVRTGWLAGVAAVAAAAYTVGRRTRRREAA